MESRKQDSTPRTGILEAKAKDQRHNFANSFQKKGGSSPKKFAIFPQNFGHFPKKKVFINFHEFSDVLQDQEKEWSWSCRIFNKSKIVLSSSQGQGIFEDLQASRTWPSRPRTSNCVLGDVLKAKNILENSTSAIYSFTWKDNDWSGPWPCALKHVADSDMGRRL